MSIIAALVVSLPTVDDARFNPDQEVLHSGIYRVDHHEHRESHEVSLLRGERFPACSVCGDRVGFSLVHKAEDATSPDASSSSGDQDSRRQK